MVLKNDQKKKIFYGFSHLCSNIFDKKKSKPNMSKNFAFLFQRIYRNFSALGIRKEYLYTHG